VTRPRPPAAGASGRGAPTRRWLILVLLSALSRAVAAEPPAPAPAATPGEAEAAPAPATPLRLVLTTVRHPSAQQALAVAVESAIGRLGDELAAAGRLQLVEVVDETLLSRQSVCGEGTPGMRCWGELVRKAHADFALLTTLRRRRDDCWLDLRLLHGPTSTIAREISLPLPACAGKKKVDEQLGPQVVAEVQAGREAEEGLAWLLHGETGPGGDRAPLAADPRDLSGMVRIPGGHFLLGSGPEEGEADERPARRIELATYWIDRTEVSLAAYRTCVLRGECVRPSLPIRPVPASRCTWGKDELVAHPMTCVTWEQARAYCRAQGKTLPSEARWERAARGTAGRRFPWGGSWPPPAGGPNLADEAARELLAGWPLIQGYDDGHPLTAPTDRPTTDRTPEGAVDLGGNVAEWILDCYDETSYLTLPEQDPLRKGAGSCSHRVARGGSWFQEHPSYLRAANRQPAPPGSISPMVGFRCVCPERRP